MRLGVKWEATQFFIYWSAESYSRKFWLNDFLIQIKAKIVIADPQGKYLGPSKKNELTRSPEEAHFPVRKPLFPSSSR